MQHAVFRKPQVKVTLQVTKSTIDYSASLLPHQLSRFFGVQSNHRFLGAKCRRSNRDARRPHRPVHRSGTANSNCRGAFSLLTSSVGDSHQRHWLARRWRTSVAILAFSIPNNIEGGSISPFRLRRHVGPSPTVPGADVMVKEEGAAPFAEPERRSELLHCWKS